MEKQIREKQHHERCRIYQIQHGSSDNPYGWDYSLRRHIPSTENQIYGNYKDEDQENKHTQKSLKTYSQEVLRIIFQKEMYYVKVEQAFY